MECQGGQAVWPQDPVHFSDCLPKFRPWHMDERVKGRDASPRLICDVQSKHVTLHEGDALVQTLRLLHHARRQINTADFGAARVQAARDLSRAAPQITDRPDASRALGQPVQKLTVQRFPAEFIENLIRVRLHDPVIRVLQTDMPVGFHAFLTASRLKS